MDRVDAARAFLRDNGRPIDVARFAYHFGGGTQAELLDALAGYQNPDGGFGHGLEVDIKAPDSNPFATELALRICLRARIPSDDPLVRRTVAYLEESQSEDGDWHFSEGVYQHDLAPWFAGWTFPSLNPSCTLSGLLKEYGLGSDRLHGRVETLFREMARPEDMLADAYYAVRPYVHYFMPSWDHPQRQLYLAGALWWLIRQHVEGKLDDAIHFFEYAWSPDTYTGANLPQSILDVELDRLAAEQQPDGGWPTSYDPNWRAPSTVDGLLALKNFGRVAVSSQA